MTRRDVRSLRWLNQYERELLHYLAQGNSQYSAALKFHKNIGVIHQDLQVIRRALVACNTTQAVYHACILGILPLDRDELPEEFHGGSR